MKSKKEITKAIRDDIKDAYPDYKFSVTANKSLAIIHVNLMEAPVNVLKESNSGYCPIFTREEMEMVMTEKACLMFEHIMNIASKYESLYITIFAIGKKFIPFRVATKDDKVVKKASAPKVTRHKLHVDYDAHGTKFESSKTNLYIDGKKVIMGYETFSGQYHFAVEVAEVRNGDTIYYGYTQGQYYEWGYFSKAELEQNKFKAWAIKKIDLPHAGKRDFEANHSRI